MAATFRPRVSTQKSDLPTASRGASSHRSARGMDWFSAQLPGEYSCLLTGITCVPSGTVVVCDNENKSVKRFSVGGKFVDKITLIDPCGICYVPKSLKVVVTEPDVHRLTFCSLEEHIAISTTSKTLKKYECITALDERKLIVGCCELGAMSVDVIDCEGHVLRSIENNDNGKTKLFRNPAAITCHTSGEILISDPGSCTLICISPDGKTRFRYDPGGRPSGVCVDSTGMIYMAQIDANSVYRLSPKGEKESVIVDPGFAVKSPLAMAVDEKYLVLTEEMPSNRIFVINLAPLPERQATGLSLSNVRVWFHQPTASTVEAT